MTTEMKKVIGIGNGREYDRPVRLVVTLELQVGDLAGDLAPRGFQTIEHTPCPPGTLNLSVTHDLIDRGKRRGDATISCGAGIPREYLDLITEWDEGWDRARLAGLIDLADRWHLNTLKAGCAHQEPVYADDRYGRRVPSLDLTPACPETGYRYGTAWLVEPLPDEVMGQLAGYGLAAPRESDNFMDLHVKVIPVTIPKRRADG